MRFSSVRAWALCTLATASAVVAPHGCTTSSSGNSGDAGSELGDARAERDLDAPKDSGPADCPASPNAPTGWVPYQGYGRCCGLQVPSTPEYLPPPVEWEPCNQPLGVNCRQIKVNWDAVPPYSSGGIAFTNSSGKAYLMAVREVAEGRYTYVAEADGRVMSAVLSMDTPKCLVTTAWQPLSANRYMYMVVENLSEHGGGFLGGTFEEIAPSVHHRYDDDVTHDWLVGEPGILDVADGFHLLAWPSTTYVQTIASSGTDHGLLQNFAFFDGPMLHWSANSSYYGKARIWTEETGAIDLIDYGSAPPPHGVDDLGTDLVDMAWTEGFGQGDAAALYASAAYFTSPYTTNPKDVVPRRIHSADNYGFGVGPFKVGCGMAVRSAPWGLIVLRLSDGHAWRLPSNEKWSWGTPWGITCTELFAQANDTIARVTLSSLGEGEPAD